MTNDLYCYIIIPGGMLYNKQPNQNFLSHKSWSHSNYCVKENSDFFFLICKFSFLLEETLSWKFMVTKYHLSKNHKIIIVKFLLIGNHATFPMLRTRETNYSLTAFQSLITQRQFMGEITKQWLLDVKVKLFKLLDGGLTEVSAHTGFIKLNRPLVLSITLINGSFSF